VNCIQKTEQILWLDYDNDGDKDLLLTNMYGQIRLYNNAGDLNLTDVTAIAGFTTAILEIYGAAAGDYDLDGDLDIFFDAYEPNLDDLLYRNNGDGTFTDVTNFAGVADPGKPTFCSAFFDYDWDGYPDLYSAQDKIWAANTLFKNNADGTFSDVSVISNTGVEIDAMTLGIADYDNDDDLDIYLSNGPEGNVLLQNQADGTFIDVAPDLGLTVNKGCWGANWLDVDLDLDLDIYVCAQDTGLAQASELLINQMPVDTFIPMILPGDIKNNFANAVGDFNHDGLPDIAVSLGTNYNMPIGKFQLWQNCTSTSSHWLKVRLHGVVSNRDAIGSKIECYVDSVKQIRYTHCGIAYLAQNSLAEHFGLDTFSNVDSIKVIWPLGSVTTLYHVPADQTLHVYEADHIYVDSAAVGDGNGFTWTDAFTDLTDALTFAASTHVKQIWIKEGVYAPSDTNRNVSFVLTSGVKIYGGFNGTETLLSQRQPTLHPVVLSGDVGAVGVTSDNSFHVVTVPSDASSVVLDGVQIADGNANGPDTEQQFGAGISCFGEVLLRQVTISNCQAVAGGSAISVTGISAGVSLQEVAGTNNTFPAIKTTNLGQLVVKGTESTIFE
jgi:hypothetical protein